MQSGCAATLRSTACEIVHTEVDAVVAGPNADGTFPASTYPLESTGRRNLTVPNRLEAFRDFAQVWHDEVAAEPLPERHGLARPKRRRVRGVSIAAAVVQFAIVGVAILTGGDDAATGVFSIASIALRARFRITCCN